MKSSAVRGRELRDFNAYSSASTQESGRRGFPKKNTGGSSLLGVGPLLFGGLEGKQKKSHHVGRCPLKSDEPTWSKCEEKGALPAPVSFHHGRYGE